MKNNKIVFLLKDDFGMFKLPRKKKKKVKKSLIKWAFENHICEYCGSNNIVDPISETCFNGMCYDCGSHW